MCVSPHFLFYSALHLPFSALCQCILSPFPSTRTDFYSLAWKSWSNCLLRPFIHWLPYCACICELCTKFLLNRFWHPYLAPVSPTLPLTVRGTDWVVLSLLSALQEKKILLMSTFGIICPPTGDYNLSKF